MNISITLLLKTIVVVFIFTACSQNRQTSQSEEKLVIESSTKIEMKEKLLRHVVIFKFKDAASEEDVNRLNQSFNDVAKAIPEVLDFEWGLNDSPEDFHQDFTHCYLLTFASEKDRDSIYTPHPKHKAFVESLGPHLEKVFVVDYWTNP